MLGLALVVGSGSIYIFGSCARSFARSVLRLLLKSRRRLQWAIVPAQSGEGHAFPNLAVFHECDYNLMLPLIYLRNFYRA